jgi:predicted permease
MRPNLPAADAEEARAITVTLAEPVAAWNPAVEVLGRLDDPAQATAVEAALLSVALANAPEQTGGAPIHTTVRLSSFASMSAHTGVLGIVLALQALIVVIAIANVTNVLFASTASRAREIGTRLALGASRARIARQLLTEGALISVGAGALGLLMAQWLTPLLANILTATPTFDWNPDGRVFLVAAISAVVAGLTASVAPIRYVRRGDLLSALRAERMGAPRGQRLGRLRLTTIAVQAAASIVLLVVAALFSRSAVRLLSTDLGFDPDRLVSAYVSFSGVSDPVRLASYLTAARDRLRQLPGVSAVGLSTGAPFELSVAALPGGRYVHRAMTSPDFFTLRGARILRGRAYTTDDLVAGAHVAVISQSLAHQYWGDEDPVGSSLERVWGPDDRPGTYGLTAKPAGTRVVGVAADMVGTIENIDAMAIYMPLRRKDLSVARILIETSTPAAGLEEPIRKTLRSLSADPGIAIKTTIVSTYVDQLLAFPKAMATITSIVGLVALGLAAIGLFGVMAFVVGQRQHEMAVRTALGARAGDIVRMLLREGLRPVLFGLAAGLVLAFVVSRLLQRVFYGVSEHDPIAITVAIAVLLAAAAAAILIPARRAAKIDPARMLREQ